MIKFISYITFTIILTFSLSLFSETYTYKNNVGKEMTYKKGGFGNNSNITQCRKIFSFKAAEARQGIAVDEKYVYVIDNRAIGKYEKNTGTFIAKWEGEMDRLYI